MNSNSPMGAITRNRVQAVQEALLKLSDGGTYRGIDLFQRDNEGRVPLWAYRALGALADAGWVEMLGTRGPGRRYRSSKDLTPLLDDHTLANMLSASRENAPQPAPDSAPADEPTEDAEPHESASEPEEDPLTHTLGRMLQVLESFAVRVGNVESALIDTVGPHLDRLSARRAEAVAVEIDMQPVLDRLTRGFTTADEVADKHIAFDRTRAEERHKELLAAQDAGAAREAVSAIKALEAKVMALTGLVKEVREGQARVVARHDEFERFLERWAKTDAEQTRLVNKMIDTNMAVANYLAALVGESVRGPSQAPNSRTGISPTIHTGQVDVGVAFTPARSRLIKGGGR